MSNDQVSAVGISETVELLRQALRAAWPGVQFSVGMAEGTANGWLDVAWEDGPTSSAVNDVCGRYRGHRLAGRDDTYPGQLNSLVQFAGEELPRQVRFACYGVTTRRSIGREGYAFVSALINAVQPGAAKLRRDGRTGLEPGWLTGEAAAKLDLLPRPVDLERAAWRLHATANLTPKHARVPLGPGSSSWSATLSGSAPGSSVSRWPRLSARWRTTCWSTGRVLRRAAAHSERAPEPPASGPRGSGPVGSGPPQQAPP